MRPSGDLRDSGVWEIGVEGADGGIKLAGGHEMTRFPNSGAGVPRADLPGIGPSVEAKDIRCQGGSNVHGATIHADDAPGTAHQPDEFGDRG